MNVIWILIPLRGLIHPNFLNVVIISVLCVVAVKSVRPIAIARTVLYKWMHHNLLVSIVSLCRRDCTEAGAILFVDFTLKIALQKNIHTIINRSRQRVHTFRIICLNYIECAFFFSSARKERIVSLPPMNIYKMCAYLLLRCIRIVFALHCLFHGNKIKFYKYLQTIRVQQYTIIILSCSLSFALTEICT